jgi:hypothetical protein
MELPTQGHPRTNCLHVIARAPLELYVMQNAHGGEAGRDWKTVRGIRSARRFGRVLARAKRRKAAQC